LSDSDASLDLVSIGDLMIDFTCVGAGDSGMLRFERNPGGAPMNVAAQLSRLGGKAAAIACVGADEHGDFLKDALLRLGVDVTNVRYCAAQGTRILFVYFRDGGERYFADYRGPRADLEIPPDDIDYSRIGRARTLLTSPLCNTYNRPIYETTRRALAEAERHGVLLAFDANYRFPYENDKLRQLDVEAILGARILKMTSEEFAYYLGETDVIRGSERLLAGNASVVAVSMGRGGSLIHARNGHAYRPAYAVNAIDTTGAGDSFMGALLYCLTRPGVDMDALCAGDLGRVADFANACAAASTTRRGALLAMPDLAEAERIMAAVSRAPSVM
jgi:sugar/nucleoside kinase (ribokinase family)